MYQMSLFYSSCDAYSFQLNDIYFGLVLHESSSYTPIFNNLSISLHDALPISHRRGSPRRRSSARSPRAGRGSPPRGPPDRKSTRLNSSHVAISYAVFCLKKRKTCNKKW